MPVFLTALFAKFKTELIIGGIAALLIGICYFYFTYSQNKIAQLEQQMAVQQVQIEGYKKSIDTLQQDAQNTRRNQEQLNQDLSTVRDDVEKQKTKLEEMDLSSPAVVKHPDQLEKSVNSDTSKLWNDFENLTKTKGKNNK